jgi:hypothetical protein
VQNSTKIGRKMPFERDEMMGMVSEVCEKCLDRIPFLM